MPAACPELNETIQFSSEPVRFGEVLRNHRRAAGMTQEELAERAGISPRSISGLERGEGATPRRDTVAQLVQALGLAGSELVEFKALVVAGGVGKTRLARELARLHASKYADGAWLVELGELTEPAQVAGAVAAV